MTVLNMTPLSWLGCKTWTQTYRSACIYLLFEIQFMVFNDLFNDLPSKHSNYINIPIRAQYSCHTCFSMGDLGMQVSVCSSVRLSVHLFVCLSLCPSVCLSVNIYPQCLVSATLTVLYRSVWNFAYVFFMVWGCACGLDIIVRSFLSLFPHCEL